MIIPAASPWLFAISSFLIFAIVPAYTQQITGRPGSPEATTTIPSMVPALPPFFGILGSPHWGGGAADVGLGFRHFKITGSASDPVIAVMAITECSIGVPTVSLFTVAARALRQCGRHL